MAYVIHGLHMFGSVVTENILTYVIKHMVFVEIASINKIGGLH